MNIAIDGFEINSRFTGVGRFLYNLLDALVKIDKKNHYTLFVKEIANHQIKSDNLKTVILNSEKSHTRWQNSDLKDALKRENFDLFFSPNHSIPFFYKGLSLMTIPDVSWKGVPGDFSFKERTVRDIKTRFSIKKSPLIFTISEFSKKEIIKHYGVSQGRVIPIHLGIEDKFKRSTKKNIIKFREKYRLGSSHLIGFLGSMFERRHINELIAAFNEFKRKIDVKLILAGENQYKKGPNDINSNGIIYIQRLPEKEINDFYSSLDLFVYLSKYEGFGFPPIEALKCKTPSLLLKSSSLSEIYKDIGYFINSTDPKELSQKMEAILTGKINRKQTFIGNLIEKKDYFSWERVANDFLKYFKDTINMEKQ